MASDTVGALVDELGALEKELSPIAGKIKRAENLRKLIRARYEDSDALKAFQAEGTRFVAVLGAKALESEIDVPKAGRLLGAKRFYGIASVTLKALQAFPDVLAAVVRREATGTRSLTLLERGGVS